MPSTYTTSGIELIGAGEQTGTWGDTTNDNLQVLDRMVSQAGTISLSGTTHTLTISDGTLSDGQYAVLVFGGSPSGTNTVTISPNDAKRLWFVKNSSGQSVILTQGSGGNVTVADGKVAIVYCDGGGSGAAVVELTGALSGVLLTSDIDTTVQGYDAGLADIAGLAVTNGNFIVGDGTNWVAESGNTALASLGVTATAAELNTLDGVTATTAELNILDGVTATATEINLLDGVTATTAELNILDGVTATATELNILDGVTATTAELNILDGVTATTAELNILDGVTATATELNLLDGLTGKTGADVDLVTGTAGTDGNLAQWNADGDVVDGPDVLDEDDMASDSAAAVPTQQSVKAYVDGQPSFTKAFVAFNGTGTPSISASHNVASITDNGTGDYTVNFSSALASANYVAQITTNQVTTHTVLAYVTAKGTSTLRLKVLANTGGENALPRDYDATDINVVIFA